MSVGHSKLMRIGLIVSSPLFLLQAVLFYVQYGQLNLTAILAGVMLGVIALLSYSKPYYVYSDRQLTSFNIVTGASKGRYPLDDLEMAEDRKGGRIVSFRKPDGTLKVLFKSGAFMFDQPSMKAMVGRIEAEKSG